MFIARHLERDFRTGDFHHIVISCLEMRPEASVRLVAAIATPVGAAAMAIIRLDELSQNHHPLTARMIRALIATQDADGGWGDVLLTALCVRALSCSHGQGPALDRGIAYLAQLQRTDGAWPSIPLRRMPGDLFVTALVVQQLSEHIRFASAVNLQGALDYLDQRQSEMDLETERLWRSICRRNSATPRSATSTQLSLT